MTETELIPVAENGEHALPAAQFPGLADIPPELEWFANSKSAQTRRAYRADLRAFTRFVGRAQPPELRVVTNERKSVLNAVI